MIITLRGADFSTNNINDLIKNWSISIAGAGLTYNCPNSVEKGSALESFTITVDTSKYTFDGGVTVTMSGSAVANAFTVSGNVITINRIAEVTGIVKIVVSTTAIGGSSGGDDPSIQVMHTITYVCKDSDGNTIQTTTEQVNHGTTKTFTAPTINGYTFSSASHTSTTVNSDITVTYTYTQASVGEITTFFTSGTQGTKKESPTLFGFTWVMPKQFLTSRVNAITVPVHLYKDEYEYVDIMCEIMEPQATGSTAAPTKKEGLCAVTRMTEDGNAIFNISFDASDIIADQCLIGVKALGGKKLAFKDTSGSSDWKTATVNTGSSKGADPCCTYYANASGAWAASSNVNTRYLELSTDKTAATKYTLTASGAENGLVRTSSNYGCVGGIASGADIYTNDVLNLSATADNIVIVDNDANEVNMPLTVTNNVSMAILEVEDDGTFFENGTAGGGGSDTVSTTVFNGWLWPMPKKYITAPVSQVSVPSLVLREDQAPVTITCELLDSSLNTINGKTVTETVSNASGGHDFNLAFTRNDITEDWCYIAIYVDGESRTAGEVFGFDKVASTAEWYVEISDKTKYPPYYKNGTGNNWASSSSSNQRHIALKTNI